MTLLSSSYEVLAYRTEAKEKFERVLENFRTREKGYIVLTEGESNEIRTFSNSLAARLEVKSIFIPHKAKDILAEIKIGGKLIIYNFENILHWPENVRKQTLSSIFSKRNEICLALAYRPEKSSDLYEEPEFRKIVNEADFTVKLKPLSEAEVDRLVELFFKDKPGLTYERDIILLLRQTAGGKPKKILALLKQLAIEAQRTEKKVITKSLLEEISH